MSRTRRSASSQRWLSRQAKDPYVRKAKEGNWRSRAAFKLAELDQRDRLFRPGQRVVDLGAAPGGWSQYLAGRVHQPVVALDLLAMPPLPGVCFLQGDFLDPGATERIVGALDGAMADAVVSDMAPNLSGVRDRDEARMRELVDAALTMAERVLGQGGLMVVKIFEGGDRAGIVDAFRRRFSRVSVRKPGASRTGSAECYVVATGYNRPEQRGNGDLIPPRT